MPRRPVSAVLALLLGVAGAAAQDAAPPRVLVELNRLESDGGGCRATVVVDNGTAGRIESIKLDLVIFDAGGVVAKRIAAELGPLAADKTVVKTFPVAGIGCDAISRVLVNDVMACAGPGGALPDCLTGLVLTSKIAAVPLNK